MRAWPWSTKAQDQATPESSPGGPVYQARIDPAIGAGLIVESQRLAAQRDLHLYGEKTQPAAVFSHFRAETLPSPMASAMAGLAAHRDQIERLTSRKDTTPFPGVELGHVPAFAPAPSTNPIVQPLDHYTHHAHEVESKRKTRLRFGH